MSRGHIVVLVSLLAFLGLIAPSVMTPANRGPIPALHEMLITLAFATLYLGIWVGATLIGIDKG